MNFLLCDLIFDRFNLIEENFLEEKKALLAMKLQELSKPINGYELCDEIKHCRVCPYVELCGREEQI